MTEEFHDPTEEVSNLIREAIIDRSAAQTSRQEIVETTRDILIREGMIARFQPAETKEGTLYAMIDGASIKERTQGMDLICVAVAGMADGYNTYNLPSYESPFMGWSTAVEYHRDYEVETQAIMMMCEVGILGMLPDYNFRGMDGAYSTSLINIIRTVQDTGATLIGKFLSDDDNAHKVLTGYRALLNPPEQDGAHILGIAKSDSTHAFVDEYRDIVDGAHGHKMSVLSTDRVLASNVLRPGEMLLPLDRGIGKDLASGFSTELKKLNISKEAYEALSELDGLLRNNTLSNRVFSTYFAPSANAQPGKVMRVDFSVPRPYTDIDDDGILDFADAAVQVVNDDVVSLSYSEPYAQYRVDRFCKDTITGALKQAKSAAQTILNEQDPTGVIANNMLNNYRT